MASCNSRDMIMQNKATLCDVMWYFQYHMTLLWQYDFVVWCNHSQCNVWRRILLHYWPQPKVEHLSTSRLSLKCLVNVYTCARSLHSLPRHGARTHRVHEGWLEGVGVCHPGTRADHFHSEPWSWTAEPWGCYFFAPRKAYRLATSNLF